MKEMKKVSRDASLHPSTVKNHKEHTQRRRMPSQLNKNSPVRQISLPFNQLDPRIQAVVLELTGGDKTRIRVLGPEEALVVNQSRLKEK